MRDLKLRCTKSLQPPTGSKNQSSNILRLVNLSSFIALRALFFLGSKHELRQKQFHFNLIDLLKNLVITLLALVQCTYTSASIMPWILDSEQCTLQLHEYAIHFGKTWLQPNIKFVYFQMSLQKLKYEAFKSGTQYIAIANKENLLQLRYNSVFCHI